MADTSMYNAVKNMNADDRPRSGKGARKFKNGREYESMGNKNEDPRGSQDRPDPPGMDSEHEWPHETIDENKKIEYWRRVPKEKPTS
jgi:hypothetical protein